MSVETTAAAAASADGAAYPPARAGWFMVVMLTIAYVFSFIDRYILSLLIEPIKADLKITDEQVGWVIGWSFAVFYSTMGVPLGWLADRARRTWLIAAGVAVWSLATAASGLARSFWNLFFARMMIGVGEATLSPAAYSLLADSFPPERRGKPIAFYSMAQSTGAALASLAGGAVLVWAKSTESVDAPLFGPLAPWQIAFFAVGLPGLIVAAVFFLMPEPLRRKAAARDSNLKGNSFGDAVGYVVGRWGTYASFVSLVCVMTIIAYSQQFLASTYARTWGWKVEDYAFVNGVALLAIAPATVFAMGWLSDRWMKGGLKEAPFRLLTIGFLLMLPTGIIPYFMPTGELAFAAHCVNTVGIAMVSAVNVNALLLITPAPIRGQVVALFYVAISLSGLLLGPTTVGALSTRVFGEENIRWAMACVPAIFGVVPLLILPVARRLYLRQLARIGAAST